MRTMSFQWLRVRILSLMGINMFSTDVVMPEETPNQCFEAIGVLSSEHVTLIWLQLASRRKVKAVIGYQA